MKYDISKNKKIKNKTKRKLIQQQRQQQQTHKNEIKLHLFIESESELKARHPHASIDILRYFNTDKDTIIHNDMFLQSDILSFTEKFLYTRTLTHSYCTCIRTHTNTHTQFHTKNARNTQCPEEGHTILK